jgi:hypothetical protein
MPKFPGEHAPRPPPPGNFLNEGLQTTPMKALTEHLATGIGAPRPNGVKSNSKGYQHNEG